MADTWSFYRRIRGLKELTPVLESGRWFFCRISRRQKGGLFVVGSIHTEMAAILDDSASPLFNRITHDIAVEYWDSETLFARFGTTREGQRLRDWQSERALYAPIFEDALRKHLNDARYVTRDLADFKRTFSPAAGG